MGPARMGPDVPRPDTTWAPTMPFWLAAAEQHLEIPRCDGCGAWCGAPASSAGAARVGPSPPTAVSGRGRLHSSVVRHAFLPAFADRVPFVCGLVALDEDACVRLVTEVVDARPEELVCDQVMEAVFAPLRLWGIERSVVAPLWRPSTGA